MGAEFRGRFGRTGVTGGYLGWNGIRRQRFCQLEGWILWTPHKVGNSSKGRDPQASYQLCSCNRKGPEKENALLGRKQVARPIVDRPPKIV